MSKEQHWSVAKLRKISPALSRYAAPAYEQISEGAGELEGYDLYHIEVAVLYSPGPIGVAKLYKRAPYTNPDGHRERIESTLSRGWLESSGEGAYVASEKGSQLYIQYLQLYKESLAQVESIPETDLDRLGTLLARVIVAANRYDKVIDKPALDLSMREIIDDDSPYLQKILTQVVQLLSYRDDAHVAAWSLHKIDGKTWEAFSDIWSGEVSTAKELAEKRPFRRYTEEDYSASLDELERKGWVKGKEGSYTITEEGRRVREEAEDLTNHYYDVPWSGLNSSEAEELEMLMDKVIERHEPEPVPA